MPRQARCGCSALAAQIRRRQRQIEEVADHGRVHAIVAVEDDRMLRSVVGDQRATQLAGQVDTRLVRGGRVVGRGHDDDSRPARKVAQKAEIEYQDLKQQGGIEVGEGGVFPGSEVLDDRTIVSFTIKFQPNQPDFSADRYGAEFNRAIQAASTFGNAVIVIRGHADPTKALLDMIKAGFEKGTIKRSGQSGNYQYFLNGKRLDLTQTATVLKLIETGAFETPSQRPRETVQAALNLSLARAEAVKQSLIDFAKVQQVNLDASQLQPTGAGISEPLIPKPENFEEALQNMRVEFRIVRVPAEALQESDFEF